MPERLTEHETDTVNRVATAILAIAAIDMQCFENAVTEAEDRLVDSLCLMLDVDPDSDLFVRAYNAWFENGEPAEGLAVRIAAIL